MKRTYIKTLLSVMALGTLFSCHDLNVPVTSELTPDVFPTSDAQFISAAGPAYVALRGNISVEFFHLQTLSTDEAIFPAKGGNWYNGAEFKDLHYHTWTKDHSTVTGNWVWLSTIIGTVNQSLSILEANMPAGNTKNQTLAELKMVRALAYFWMMDSYGNVPITTTYGDYSAHPNMPRAQVFTFIETEIKAALPNLSETVDITTYGRPTKFLAQALLAKLYLNAEIYTGTNRNNDCIAACDQIINSGKFSLEPAASYLQMFYPNNGPQMKEFIFAIPFDATSTSGFPFRCTNLHSRYDIPRGLVSKYKMPFTPDAAVSTLPEFYKNFNDPNDIRNKEWLTGLQYNTDGTPATVTTTKKGYDQFYSGADPSAPYTYQVNITPEVTLRQDVASFDVGNDELAWNMGYRNIKFYPDASSLNRNQNNDVPIFRYADAILMKAEAIQRGGTATGGATALALVNLVRTARQASAAVSLTLDNIYEERIREFASEMWHRNDMIRFGKYEGKWGYKTDSDIRKRIFPIPNSAMQLNPALVQNPGY
jgi:starch-binding outer membrane protein, SusD/RagB family